MPQAEPYKTDHSATSNEDTPSITTPWLTHSQPPDTTNIPGAGQKWTTNEGK